MGGSRRTMRWSGAIVVLAGVVALAFATPVLLFVVLPTALTLGAVAWVMWGGADDGSRPGDSG